VTCGDIPSRRGPEDPAGNVPKRYLRSRTAGVVAEVGPGVVRFKQGDVYAYTTSQGAASAVIADRGPSSPANLHVLHMGFQRDGGMGEYLLAEEQSCMPLPDELSSRTAL